MKITNKDLIDSGISQLVKNDKGVAPARTEGDKGAEQNRETAKVTISSEARYLQKAAELAGRGDELRAAKVNRIKEQIAEGTYHVDAKEVAQSIARSEVARLLNKQ
ncbi:MAG TPA: flagellar biosynthesis anti-sigma factor FlgM [Candidatus Binatia bacterium]